MGLDISVYSNVQSDCEARFEDGEFDIYAKNYSGMEAQLSPWEDGDCLSGDFAHSFRAGSYSGYNIWRNQLAELMLKVPAEHIWENADEYKDKPFYYLINFSDCEGVIGSDIAEILYNDFVNYEHILKDINDEYFVSKYHEWTEAFNIAKNDGCVVFH